VYKVWLSKLLAKRKFRDMYLDYHIIDTGEHGTRGFTSGINYIDGIARAYARERVQNGTLYYESNNSEPLKISRDISQYKYYCDTKNFDTISRNTILETLMILNAKNMLILLIIVACVVSIIMGLLNAYLTKDSISGLTKTVEAMNNTIPR
jgi:hypothetical protein